MGMLMRKNTEFRVRLAYRMHRPLRASDTSSELGIVHPSTEGLYENRMRCAGRVQHQSPCSW